MENQLFLAFLKLSSDLNFEVAERNEESLTAEEKRTKEKFDKSSDMSGTDLYKVCKIIKRKDTSQSKNLKDLLSS